MNFGAPPPVVSSPQTDDSLALLSGWSSLEASAAHSFLSPFVFGLTYGVLHVIGPDHLGILISLSVAAGPKSSFGVGAAWSLGHCCGMVLVACVVLLVERVTHVNLEAWEYVGDYLIGVCMITCGIYFAIREQSYIFEEADGSISLVGCACHGGGSGAGYGATTSGGTESSSTKRRSGPGKRLNMSSDYSDPNAGWCRPCSPDSSSESGEDQETGTLSASSSGPPAEAAGGSLLMEAAASLRENAGNACLGIVQGLCCPMGLLGVSFMASLPAAGIFVFMVTFLLVSALGMGLFTALWSRLLQSQAIGKTSGRAIYRTSCIFTTVLGVAWVVANYFGVLDKLNFAESHQPMHHSLDDAH